MTERSLADKVAIVTGAGQGVGRGIALALAEAGCTTVVCGRTLSKCEDTAALIAERGQSALALRCDVGIRADVDACVQATLERFGRVDVLVNNAQTVRLGTVLDITEEDMAVVYETGPVGALRFMQACFPALRESGGAVINLASGSGVRPQPGQTPYAAAKEGMRALTRCAASEWGVHGVRVNAICPFAASPAMDGWRQAVPDEYEQALQNVYLRRIGDCERDIGPAAVFLAGDGARYITGATLMIDGGQNHLG
jgi:NAD(P)-dependent dehydrogenase (short-subunit alcohol dehydrogenase family)